MGRRPFVKERILEAAFDLVARRGYEAVSTREIAAAAAVGHASMYRHFPSKEDLGRELYRRALAPLVADLEELLARAGDEPHGLLPAAVALFYGWYDQRPRALALLIFEPHDFTPAELDPACDDTLRARLLGALRVDAERGSLIWGALTGPLQDRYLGRRQGAMAPHAERHGAIVARLLDEHPVRGGRKP